MLAEYRPAAPSPRPARRGRWRRSALRAGDPFAPCVRARGLRWIGFLARGASQHPDPQVILRPLALEQPGHLGVQRIELGRVAEELGDADPQILEQVLHLFAVAAQPFHIGLDRVDLQHLHAALHPAGEGAALVAVKIAAGDIAQDGGDLRQMRLKIGGHLVVVGADRLQAGHIAPDLSDDRIGGQMQVDHAEGARAIARLVLRGPQFGNRQAAEPLGRRHPGGAVASKAGKDDDDRTFMGMLGQRDQQRVDGAAMADRLGGGPDMKMAVHDRHHVVGPADIDMVRGQRLAVLRDADLQRRMSLQRVHHGCHVQPFVLAHRDQKGGAHRPGQFLEDRPEGRRSSAVPNCPDGALPRSRLPAAKRPRDDVRRS